MFMRSFSVWELHYVTYCIYVCPGSGADWGRADSSASVATSEASVGQTPAVVREACRFF